MMKNRLRFMFLLVAASLLFSCASKNEESADETPVVEAEVSESTPVVVPEPVTVVSEPAAPVESSVTVSEPADSAEPASCSEQVEDGVAVSETEPVADMLIDDTEDETLTEEEDWSASSGDAESSLVEEEPVVYIVDVSSYYEGFAISEDDFIAVEVPEPELPVVSEPLMVEDAVIAEEEPADENEIASAENAPVMEPLKIPAPREELKKPVEVISEAQASENAALEKEVAVSELEEILAAIPEPEKPAGPVASRSISVNKNDIIEVPYQGNWWVYLGDENSSGALTFTGRDYVSEKTVFTLRASKEGQALLHFFKQDIIANVMVDDYLEVVVEEADGVSEKTTLDMFIISQIKPEPVVAEEGGEGEDAVPETATATASPVTSTASTPSAQIYQNVNAPVSVNSRVVDEAPVIDYVEEAVPVPVLSDAELFAQAQALEATDIEGALELYKQLVAKYPASPYWTKANNRITYINRFYFFKR